MVRLWEITHKGNWPEQKMIFQGKNLEEVVHAFKLWEEDHGSSARPEHIIKIELIGESLN